MAVPARQGPKRAPPLDDPDTPFLGGRFTGPAYPEKRKHKWTDVQRVAARLYAQTFTRAEISRLLYKHMTTKHHHKTGEVRTRPQRIHSARSKLRTWEQEQWFRDEVYRMATVATDMAVPDIMRGVVRKAKAGRVDAAKFALEIAGRWDPGREETAPTQIHLNLQGIGRPDRTVHPATSGGQDEVDGEIIEAYED